jgi:hypothetical protein
LPALPDDARMLLFFWSPNCPTCEPALAAAKEAARQRDATLLVLAQERPDAVEVALVRQGIGRPAPLLCGATPTFRAYQAHAPTFVLVGGDHRVIDRSDEYLPGAPIFRDWQ